MMPQNMLIQIAPHTGSVGTQMTLEWLFPSVGQEMSFQITRKCEDLSTSAPRAKQRPLEREVKKKSGI
jgi:hypothetical protein